MIKGPLSWMIGVLIVASLYSFFYFRCRRRRTRWFRPISRRRHRSRGAAFQFHLFDFQLQPMHLVGTGAGLDPSAIAALPVDYYAALNLLTNGRVPSECAICLNPFEDDETLRFIPTCHHAFHVTCLDPWLSEHITCPSCRANLVPAAESTRPQPQPQPQPTESRPGNDVVLAVDSPEGENQESFTLGTSPKVLWAHFWRQKAPLRLKIHVCRVLSGAFPVSRWWHCAICGGAGETSEHLFFRCPAARALWYDFWGIRTDGEATAGWTTANWVEASLFPNRFLAFDLEEEGEMFLFLGCLFDKIWVIRNSVVDGQEDEVSVERLKSAVEDSFWELRSAFIVHAGDQKV